MTILNRVRPWRPSSPPWEATHFDPACEVDPHAVGMTREGVAAIWAAAERIYTSGLSPAVGLCLYRQGRLVLDRAVGWASGGGPDDPPGGKPVAATPDTPYTIFSASKAITAMLIHLLDERGLLRLDDRVAEFIPEFGRHRKEWITIRHVLTHRAGIPTIPGDVVDMDLLLDWDRIVELLCEATPTSRPGRRLAYHALTGGYVLGEVIRRITGRELNQVMQEEICDRVDLQGPLSFGVRDESAGGVARNYHTGPRVPFPLSALVTRALGVPFEQACALSNDPRYLQAVIPAGNVVGTARSVARFFQLLLSGGQLDGVRVFSERTIRRATSEDSYLEIDLTLGLPVRYGLGLMLGRKHLSPYGPDTGRAFGHLGFMFVFTWADPAREVAACLMTNGKSLLSPAVYRVYDTMRQIARYCPKG